MDQLLFYILSSLTILSALTTVFSKNTMYSVLSLIVCFSTIAGHYILLNAQFLTITPVLVYAGAIMVLFLLVAMLLNLNAQSEPHQSPKPTLAAVISGRRLVIPLLAALRT